jgi:hypothetical protein
MPKSCILIGGGKSVREGLSTDLWEKIKGQDIWSLNYTFKMMPYLPSRQCFVDNSFFKYNEDALHDLAAKGVPIHSKRHSHMKHIPEQFIKQYETGRNKNVFRGKDAFKEPPEIHLFIGLMGLCGIFSLSLAIAEQYDIIYLCGYDQGPPSGDDKDTHWYQGQVEVKSTGVGKPTVYWNQSKTQNLEYTLKPQYQDFEIFTTVPGVKIYNVSPKSNIPYFTKITYQDFYKLLEQHNVQKTN